MAVREREREICSAHAQLHLIKWLFAQNLKVVFKTHGVCRESNVSKLYVVWEMPKLSL